MKTNDVKWPRVDSNIVNKIKPKMNQVQKWVKVSNRFQPIEEQGEEIENEFNEANIIDELPA